MGLGQLGQTITVVNKSGKVVSTSKQLINVFKEAKAAYSEKKAEIKADRRTEFEEKHARHAIQRVTIEDDTHSRHSAATSKRHHPHRSKSTRHSRPPVERGITDSFYVNDDTGRRSSNPHTRSPKSHKPSRSRTQYEQDLAVDYAGRDRRELVRRHTDTALARQMNRNSIDMDLAYGDLPPPLPDNRLNDEVELRGQMTKLQLMLDEAKCLHHTANATIDHLQKNPDALAAVALSLAEISNLASKMAPGALMAMKGSFPAVFALLASPQFLIAAGLGVGVTVVMLGGYKVIKKIKKKRENERELEEPMEMQEIDVDLSRIEAWRRGIAEAEAGSIGTTVDGEFITPMASDRLIQEGVLKPEDLKSTKSGKSRKSKARKPSRDDSKSTKGETKGKKKETSILKALFKKGQSQLV